MGNADVPQWALEKACALIDEYRREADVSYGYEQAFALYIAANEAEPVDPLLIEAREVLGKWADETWGRASSIAADYRSGKTDGDSNFRLALAALKRGMEMRPPLTREMVREAVIISLTGGVMLEASDFHLSAGDAPYDLAQDFVTRLHAALTKDQS